MNRNRLAKILTIVLALTLVLSIQVFADEITITGKINETYQIVTDKDDVYEVADSDLASELLENIGQTVKVTGTLVQSEEGVKTIRVNDYEIVEKE
jgi:lysyl-tRNA synthetase class II